MQKYFTLAIILLLQLSNASMAQKVMKLISIINQIKINLVKTRERLVLNKFKKITKHFIVQEISLIQDELNFIPLELNHIKFLKLVH